MEYLSNTEEIKPEVEIKEEAKDVQTEYNISSNSDLSDDE
jgi:hypothetical protein